MTTREDLEDVSRKTGFRVEAIERIVKLHGILARLVRHEVTAGGWVLKGGTALNLLHLDVPRLSVDIDVNYVARADVEEMKAARPLFERALVSCCAREGCDVQRAPSEHAGGKFRLRYQSVLGGMQRLEVDVSYVARIPLWGAVEARMRLPPDSDVDVPTLRLEELAAGKFTALLQRTVIRDAFDAASLLALAPDLLHRPAFRTAFVCFMAAAREDVRELVPAGDRFSGLLIERDLVPLLRPSPDGETDPAALADSVRAKVEPVIPSLMAWTPDEQRFLDALLDHGEIEAAALHADPEVQQRIRAQPMLNWKARNVREHKARR